MSKPGKELDVYVPPLPHFPDLAVSMLKASRERTAYLHAEVFGCKLRVYLATSCSLVFNDLAISCFVLRFLTKNLSICVLNQTGGQNLKRITK